MANDTWGGTEVTDSEPDQRRLAAGWLSLGVLALALAGGFKEFAARSRIVVIRSEGRAQRRIKFDYDKLGASKKPQENFPLRPGDIVMVP